MNPSEDSAVSKASNHSGRALYLDCMAGVCGSMLLGALFDAGLDRAAWERELAKLGLGDQFRLHVNRVVEKGLAAILVRVEVLREQPHRGLGDIERIIQASSLAPSIQQRALRCFRALGEAEAKMHDTTPDRVHFHEVGAVDAIVDIVGVAIGLELLGVTEVLASPIHTGGGRVQCDHGLMPVPAPATARLLQAAQAPVFSAAHIRKELTTPTGAALLAGLVRDYGPLPAMRIEHSGYGAGEHRLPFANVLRVLIGPRDGRAEEARERLAATHNPAENQATALSTAAQAASLDFPGGLQRETIVRLECNLDDSNPEWIGFLTEALYAEGALEAWCAPIQMKKGRPAVQLTLLCRPQDETRLAERIFRESTSLGLRRESLERWVLPRESFEVETIYGRSLVKAARLRGALCNAAPEYERCRELALAAGVPLKEVYAATLAAFRAESEG